MRFKDLTGLIVGRLTVKTLSGRIREKDKQKFWLCQCICGKMCEVEGRNLSDKRTQSCGCLQRERTRQASLKHGLKRRGVYNPNYYQYQRKNPHFKLKKNVSCMIYQKLKHNKGGKSILHFLPFTIPELKLHLEKQFESWMSWQNYGQWHIDHIIPQSFFNYTSFSDPKFKECWSLSNLRPLSAKENIKKGAKFG